MKTGSAEKIAAEFNDYLEASRRQLVLITWKGKPVAILLAAGRLRSLRSIFRQAHEQLEKSGGIPHDQFWQEVAQNRRGQRRARAKELSHKARWGAAANQQLKLTGATIWFFELQGPCRRPR